MGRIFSARSAFQACNRNPALLCLTSRANETPTRAGPIPGIFENRIRVNTVAKDTFDYDFRWKDSAGEVIAEDVAISPDNDNIPEKFRGLVTDGSLLATVGWVKATAKIEDNGKKSEKSAIASYVRLAATTPAAALALMDGRMKANDDGPGVLTRFNYGYDLDARGSQRNPLLQKLEGPEKAIERAVKGLMGIPGMTEARARKIVADNPPEA